MLWRKSVQSALGMAENWVPTSLVLGDLPTKPGERKAYEVPPPNPGIEGVTPNKVLVYAFVTLQNANPGFQRGYYTIYTETEDGKTQYKYYMNVASAGPGATVVNSTNAWLPYGAIQQIKPYVYVQFDGVAPLVETTTKPSEGKGHEEVLREHEGQIFATGFNMVPLVPSQTT